MKKYSIAVVGAAGYTGGELLRLLINHPNCREISAISRSQSGQAVTTIHKDLLGECNLLFTDSIRGNEDVIFLCMGHGESFNWMKSHSVSDSTIIIDLSQDHRYSDAGFVYGLSEVNNKLISTAKRIANPGCFATVIQLMLIPLCGKNILNDVINVVATTGSTGAGQSLAPTSHFTWRSNNHSAYKELAHQHLYEISETIRVHNNGIQPQLNIIPQRGSFTRGIHAVAWINASEVSADDLLNMYRDYYSNAPFVVITDEAPDVKPVVNTNKCFIHVHRVNTQIVITGVIDNLLKGASGQAIQNMNIALGLEATTGLKLKPIAY